jgi:hypothetical protein
MISKHPDLCQFQCNGALALAKRAPKRLPDWLTLEDLYCYVNKFIEAGFRGGTTYYRNFKRNWEITPQLEGATIYNDHYHIGWLEPKQSTLGYIKKKEKHRKSRIT